jgi:hypothetical protein
MKSPWSFRDKDGKQIVHALPLSDNLVIAIEGRERSIGADVKLERIVDALIGDELPKCVGRVETLLDQRV